MKEKAKKIQDLEKFKESLANKSLKELEELEQQIVKEADDNGVALGKVEFDLPTDNYKVVAEAIRMFLEKQSVQWQYTLGLVSMYDFWDPEKNPKKIPYAHLDSILRTLGGMQFQGYKEWSAVVAINKYFEPLRVAYVDATEPTYEIASRHDAVIQAIEAAQANTPAE